MTLAELIQASIAEHKTELMHSYMSRGRRFAALSVHALTEQWVDAYRATRALDDLSRETELLDLGNEFTLRRIEPPMDLIAAERTIFLEHFDRLRREPCDPKELERIEDELEDLKERLTRPKH